MFNFYRHFFSSLLILVMIINPIQIAQAIDFDRPEQATPCQISQERFPAVVDLISTGGSCISDQGSHCVDSSVCVAQSNFTSLRSSGSIVLTIQVITKLKFVVEGDAVSTHYPELLRRPPKT